MLPTFNMEQSQITNESTAHPVELSWGMLFMLAAQHVVVLFSGIILVPVMLVNIYDLNEGDAHYMICATALCAAAATLLQLIRGKKFGLGSPMFMGTSGAYMSCASSAMQLGGAPLLMGMVLITAPFQALFSYLIRYMRHIITPTVGGVIIMLAVVGLLKHSVATWMDEGHILGWLAWLEIGTGMVTIVVMLGVEWFGGNKLRPWGLAFGIIAGTLVSLATGAPVIEGLDEAEWLGLPQGTWPGITFSTMNGHHWMLALTFVFAVLATSIKYTGDAMILQKVAEPDKTKVDYDALQGGLYANSVGMLMSGLAGGMPSSSHSPNIPLMEMTGVATRKLAVIASLLLALVALSPKMLLLLLHIPQPVIGAVGVVLVAHLFSSGLQLVVMELNHRNGVITGFSLCVGLIAVSGNFYPYAFPGFLHPLVQNGVALGGLVAIILTLITHHGTHRAHTISIQPTMEQLPEFKRQLATIADKIGLNGHDAGYLELASEEVYLFLQQEFQAQQYEGRIKFSIRQVEEGMDIEVSGGTRLDQEADILAAKKANATEAMTDEELNALGLLLLGRIAHDVNHVTISGYTYIHFRLFS